MRWRIVQNQHGRFLDVKAEIVNWLNQKIRIDVARALVSEAEIVGAKDAE